RMTAHARPEVNVVVVDDYTKAALSDFGITQKHLEVRFDGADKTFELGLKEIKEFLEREPSPLVMDLYRIACSVYYADLQMLRPKTEARTVSILISVSDKSKWDAHKSHLEMTLRFLTYDNFIFNFVQGQRPRSDFKFKNTDGRVISLFSGGLDSLAGIKWLKDHQMQPILVGHTANNIIHHTMETLYAVAKKSFNNNLELVTVSASRRGKEERKNESIQASRSFLYLTLGCLFALELGISRVCLFENGVISLNIPLVQSKIFFHTRTAHPKFISDFNGILSRIFPQSTSVDNPFVLYTKGEVVRLLNDPDFENLVKDTITCSRLGLRWIKGKGQPKNCGVCLPCIVRRVGVHHAGLWNRDARYREDVMGPFNQIPHDGKTILLQILNLGRRLDREYSDVLNDIPEFYVEEQIPERLIDMMRRHHKEVLACLKDKGDPSLQSNLREFLH
ncbi:MAG: 7-cyano-7-deazaguanine synthase, partial [Nitrososphaera sp.]|nr:7-cyano-7-deazaguanine synthase [Nitrososphaera sp.]